MNPYTYSLKAFRTSESSWGVFDFALCKFVVSGSRVAMKRYVEQNRVVVSS